MTPDLVDPNPASTDSGPLYNGSSAKATIIKPLEAGLLHLIPVRTTPLGGTARRSTYTSSKTLEFKTFPRPFMKNCRVDILAFAVATTMSTADMFFNITGITSVQLRPKMFEVGTTFPGIVPTFMTGVFELDDGDRTRAVRDITAVVNLTTANVTLFSIMFWPQPQEEIVTA